ncbi:MAG: efflux RND transporter periplasmic adaptor subunit [Thermodesulfobacteriota bacterium]
MSPSKRTMTPLMMIIIALAVGGGRFLWQAADSARASGGKAGAADGRPAAMTGHVSLSPAQRVMANVATAPATEQTLAREINAVGIVQYDQSRQAKVTAWVAGRIDRLFVDRVGAVVGRNQPIAELYSPDLLAAQQEYLLAIKSRDRLRNSPVTTVAQDSEDLVRAARQRLLLLGVGEGQIATLAKNGPPRTSLAVHTPLSGVVIEKMVQQGQYVNIGDVLFSIADLSSVWVEAEVYEHEFPEIGIGQEVQIRSSAYPDRSFFGRVGLVYPFLDSKTRTVKVRIELANPGMELRPEMFVNAVIRTPLAPTIAVPVSAVLDTGKRRVVWIESSPGMFEPREVRVGRQAGGLVQILSGITAGDKVAISGGYLIDSESQLQGGAGQDHSQHTGAKPAAKPTAMEATPTAPTKVAPDPASHEGHTAPSAAPAATPAPQPSKAPPPPPPAPTGHEGHGGA